MRISDWSSDVCSSDLDAGRPAIGEDAAGLALEDREQRAGVLHILVVELERRGELAFEPFEDAGDLGLVGAADHDRGGAEHFVRQRGVGDERRARGAEQRRAATIGAAILGAASDRLAARMTAEKRDALLVRSEEHTSKLQSL